MRKLIILSLALLPFIVNAQQSNVQTAAKCLSYDPMRYADLLKAKESIDAAALSESTSNDPKMWYYRGKVYVVVANDKEAQANKLDPQAYEKAVVSFVNCLKTDTKKNYFDETKNQVWQSSIGLFNQATQEYAYGNPNLAIPMYEIIFDVFPYDTDNNLKRNNITKEILYKNIYLAAKKAGNIPVAKENLQKLIDAKFNDPRIYIWMCDMNLEARDTAAAIASIELGLESFEDDGRLINKQIGLYLMTGKTDVLIGKLAEAIEAAPDNELLYLIRGELYEAKGEIAKASADYKKVLELNPDHFIANYDLGTLFFNQAAEKVKKAAQASLADSEKLEKEYKLDFQNAQGYLEKARELNPKKTEEDMGKLKITLQSLRQIYARSNQMEKASEMKAELEKL